MLTYSLAKWKPLLNHSAPGTLLQRNLIVLHITQGSTAEGAIATFQASKAPPEGKGRGRSIGIEHVAIAEKLMATDAQYQASAALVAWLCEQLRISCDRAHVRTHNEASPQDGHVLCCTGALDPDRVVKEATC